MDLGIIGAIAMLIAWAVAVFGMNNAPGWVHMLLTGGVFLLVWRTVSKDRPRKPDA